MTEHDKFLEEAEVKTFDLKHRQTIKNNMGKYKASVQQGLTQYANHELARQRASYIKTNTMLHLDKYLLEFEANFTKNGGKVIWAKDASEALSAILKIFQKHNAHFTVKSKSMTTEEIHLNEFLETYGIKAIETDLGEYIVQLAGQKPYHIVTPAMHLSKEDISKIFVEKLNEPPMDDPEELTMVARRNMRDKYTSSVIGITGGNFLLADVGGVAITENEGNARLSVTFPKVHIAVVGIEKMLPSIHHLDLFWPLLATSGTGQQITVYNTVLTGPRQPGETDGPEEMYVILLDNGRSDLLGDPEKRQALNCIRCGACLNACPVYKNVGGHTYNTVYSGPIGSIISPHYNGMEKFKHLSYASSLCGACTSVCPVKIDIHNLLLLNRKQSVDQRLNSKLEKFGFTIWKQAMLNRSLMNMGGSKPKQLVLNTLFKNSWGKHRILPQLAPKSFNQLWKERRGGR
jgi:L-lactate dehydrogenase complex protein LldF